MVHMFNSKGNNKGVRTFFNNYNNNDCYIKHTCATVPPSILDPSVLFDFNLKIKYITQSLNRIVYYDYCIDIDILKREYNIIIFELQKIKELSPTTYPVILNNVITTFDSLLQIYKKYIDEIHLDDMILPDNTYDNITALELFVVSLQEKCIPTIYIDKCSQDLELVLFKLYQEVGNDLEQLLKLFSSGNFTKLHEELTYEVYSKLSVAVFNESYEESFGYTKVWEVINSSLEGLYKTALLEKSQRDEIYMLKAKVKMLEKQCAGETSSALLSGTATMTVFAQIRPEIKIYISKYGFPVGGVFDAIKLSEIITVLKGETLEPTPCGCDNDNPIFEPEPESVPIPESVIKTFELDVSQSIITTRSFVTGDNGVPEMILGKTINGNIVELDVANNGTWIKSITVRDGNTTGIDFTINDTIVITNIHQPLETIELSGSILTNNPDFVNALNKGEEYILIDTDGNTSLVEPSNALTNALTGGIYFQDAITNHIELIHGSANIQGITIDVMCTKIINTDSFGLINPILKFTVKHDKTYDHSIFNEGDVLLIKNNYQTITKTLTLEDANLLQ